MGYGPQWWPAEKGWVVRAFCLFVWSGNGYMDSRRNEMGDVKSKGKGTPRVKKTERYRL